MDANLLLAGDNVYILAAEKVVYAMIPAAAPVGSPVRPAGAGNNLTFTWIRPTLLADALQSVTSNR